MYRQGDVLLVRVGSIPAGLTEVSRDHGRVVLAYGEVTGHAHAFRGSHVTMFADTGTGTGGTRYLKVDNVPAELAHEEHSAIHVPPGTYEIIIQREYSPSAIRNVAD